MNWNEWEAITYKTMQRIELNRMWTKITENGTVILHGSFGHSGARIQIEPLPEPDERTGATHAIYLLPPKEQREQRNRWPKQSRAVPANVSPSGELLGYSQWPGMVTNEDLQEEHND